MKGHVAYISLLVLSFGFIAYLKMELDSVEKNYSKEYVILKKQYSGLVEVEKKLRSELEARVKELNKIENSYGAQVKSFEDSLGEKEVDLRKCQTEKSSVEESVEKLLGEQNIQLEKISQSQLDIDTCNKEKEQLTIQVNEKAQGNKGCEEQRQQCEQEKQAYETEIDDLRQAASCESDKAQVEKLNGELDRCLLANNEAELEKKANWESFHACSGQLHECDEEKVQCQEKLETISQKISSQKHEESQPSKEQQNTTPQQQQISTPQQEQKTPSQQQQISTPQQEQKTPPQQQQSTTQQQKTP